jgi:hypothetical protein
MSAVAAALAELKPLAPFFYGTLGGIVGEVVVARRFLYTGTQFPERYRRRGFYVMHGFLSLVAGAIVVAYGIENWFGSFHVGISLPILLENLSRWSPIPDRPPPGDAGQQATG